MSKKEMGKMNAGEWPWLISAMLLPVAIMIYLYQQNSAHVSFLWIIAISGAMLVASAFIWIVIRLLFHSPVSAFSACLITWILCFACNAIFDFVLPWVGIHNNRMEVIVLLIFAVALLTAFMLRKTANKQIVGIGVLVFICILLAINLMPFLMDQKTSVETRNPNQYVKKEFTVENKKDNPNIYWFHCDGMLGFDAMEKYFGDAQNEFANELTKRGFGINREAIFEAAHTTAIALPALMCPYAYDNWLAPHLTTYESAVALRDNSITAHANLLNVRVNNELIAAFRAGGYFTQASVFGVYILPVADANYFWESFQMYKTSAVDSSFMIERDNTIVYLNKISYLLYHIVKWCTDNINFQETVNTDTLVPISTDIENQGKSIHALIENNQDARLSSIGGMPIMLNDCLKMEAPHFSLIAMELAHYPFQYDENGNAIEVENDRWVANYPGQHQYAAKILLEMVDMILKTDPDAVIVLQADHGLHGNKEEDFEEAFGTVDASTEMWNSVLSAIRVPVRYQNGDEHYALETPLNMSRYLINRFVGKNYQYIVESK